MSCGRFALAVASAAAVGLFAPLQGAGPSFQPDARFEGASLAGWTPLGAATWRAENSEIIGTPTQPGGGWLLLDRSYQDISVYAEFQCTGGCTPGLLVRAERTADGIKGVLVSLAEDDVASYAVVLDADGRELSREALRSGGGQMRIAPPPEPSPSGGRGGFRGRGRGGDGPPLPTRPPETSLRPGEWNSFETFMDANIVRTFINGGGQATGGVAEDEVGRYGPVALYVGGTGEVRFRHLAYKDWNIKVRPPEQLSDRFRMQRLSDFYYSWGAGVADFNRDGINDIVAGPHIYYGPDYLSRQEIYLAYTSNPSDTYTEHAWMQYVGDFTGNGWPDVINPSFTGGEPGHGVWLYVNPQGESRRWDRHLVIPEFHTEVAVMADVNGDGRDNLVYTAAGTVRWAEPDPADPTEPWIVHIVSEPGTATAHGIGVGDINGDGLTDIVNPYGWWEQPAPGGDPDALWTYHPVAFSRYGRNIHGGSVMAVYDVNGNGLNDVVTVLNPHGWGLAWFEQKRDASGAITFERHMIMDDYNTADQNAGGVTFSQPHGSTFGDVDGDGIPDFIVGKRYWSHRDNFLDPDPYGPAVLYWYRTVRNPDAPGGAEFVPELIHNQSGAGSDLHASDIDGDGHLDIVAATRFGTFVFWGRADGDLGR